MGKLMLLLALPFGALPWFQDEPEFPRPAKEHSVLRQFEGDWDARCRVIGQGIEADREFLESSGREYAKLGYGGFWLTLDFTGEMHEKSFEGRGTLGWDPVKKKYLLTWFDSLNPRMLIAEGDADPTGKKITVVAGRTDPVTREPYQEKLVFETRDSNTRTLTFLMAGDDGERKAMEIVYTRRK